MLTPDQEKVWRDLARELRHVADSSCEHASRRTLLNIASTYERMADGLMKCSSAKGSINHIFVYQGYADASALPLSLAIAFKCTEIQSEASPRRMQSILNVEQHLIRPV